MVGVLTRLQKLLLIGGIAGIFSAVFGVGGGVVVVPLLIGLLGYDDHRATATSLAAIVLTALWGTIAHGVLGNVEWVHALLIGVRAMLGVTIGVALKRRVSTLMLRRGFALLLVAVAVALVVT